MSQQPLPHRQWIVGNWKMYKTSQEAREYWDALIPDLQALQVDVGFAVPYTLIAPSVAMMAPLGIHIGAQNMHDASEGAFTGEIAARMLRDVGATFVILGHSERRRFFGETDSLIHKKVVRAIESNLQVILCVGESWEEYEAGKTKEVLENQLKECLGELSAEQLKGVAIAYEPVWAIGSGRPATIEQVQGVHLFLRQWMEKKLGKEAAEQLRLLYGGSVQAHHAAALLAQPQVDGLLVGGSSLSPLLFNAILRAAPSQQQREEQWLARQAEKEPALHLAHVGAESPIVDQPQNILSHTETKSLHPYEQTPQQEGSL